jgi:predicted 2-oxoglutarate/Fe(II)-dependent dioxygenase YbiX
MSWFIKDLNYTNEPFVYASNVLSDDEIKLVEILASKSTMQGDGTLEAGISNDNIRKNKISWIEANEESTDLYVKISNIVQQLNERFYRYDLTEMEDLQYAEYHSDALGHYTTHSDDGYKYNLFRKLSLSIQLSDELEYQGGELLFYRFSTKDPAVAPKGKGTLILFPSYVLHEVTPVTEGLRKSLVSWVVGPRFK